MNINSSQLFISFLSSINIWTGLDFVMWLGSRMSIINWHHCLSSLSTWYVLHINKIAWLHQCKWLQVSSTYKMFTSAVIFYCELFELLLISKWLLTDWSVVFSWCGVQPAAVLQIIRTLQQAGSFTPVYPNASPQSLFLLGLYTSASFLRLVYLTTPSL